MSNKYHKTDEAKLKHISEDFIQEVCQRLVGNSRVRRTLPVWGRLHIDRQLPFLCVYRRPNSISDLGAEKLIMGEASYLVASGQRKFHKGLSQLVQQIASVLSAEFGTFLVIELWETPPAQSPPLTSSAIVPPVFRIHTPKNFSLFSTADRLQRSLRNIKIMKRLIEVELVYNSPPRPPKQLSLVAPVDVNENKIHYIGLEIPPVYRDGSTGQVFPLVLRNLHRKLARSLKQTFYEFARTEATRYPKHYQALGRRGMVQAVWRIDEQLAQISSAFDFLLFATPTNTDEAWSKFRRSNFQKSPVFFYRPLPYEPVILKRELYQIRIDQVEDPTLEHIFREKQNELDLKISMLAERGKKDFLYRSLQLYGAVDTSLWTLAQELLEAIPPRSREEKKGGVLNAESFARCAQKEIDYYRQKYDAFAAVVEIRSDIAGVLVSRGKLLIGSKVRIPASRVEALLQHEIGTHLLTYYNGKAQPFKQLCTGLTGYDELQEGLAVLSEYLVGGLSRPRLRLLAARVIATKRLIEGGTFIDTFRELDRHYDFEQRTAYSITMRTYRGGGLTKDIVYLRGLVHLLAYLKKGGTLDSLFAGKFSASHIPIINELLWREILQSPPLKPKYMDDPKALKKLKDLVNVKSILDLINKRKKS